MCAAPANSPVEIAARVEDALRAAGDPARAEQERRYLKSSLEHFGVSVPATRKVAKSVGRLDHDVLIGVVEALWERPVHECRSAAVELLDLHGALLEPADLERLIRESGLLALRRGDGDFERFAGYADAMLDEREFFIRKAIGWVLRDTARKRPDLVYEWLLPRAARASGVTRREAVKRPSPDQRTAIAAAAANA